MGKPDELRVRLTVDRRTFLKVLGMTGAGLSAGAVLDACSSSSNTGTGATATSVPALTEKQVLNAKGTVKVLGYSGYQVPQNNPPGVTSHWGYNSTNEQIITKTTQPGTFDIVIIYQGEIDQLRALHRTQPIDVSLIPNWSLLDSYFRNTPLIRRNGQVWEVPDHWGYGYCEYNTQKIPPPHSLADLMSPVLRKKVALPDDPYAVITTFALMLGIKNANSLTQSQFNRVINTLNAFKPQVLAIIQYGAEPPMFGRGDIYVSIPMYSNSFILSRQAGAPVSYTTLGAFSYVDGFHVLNPDYHLATSYAYINHSLSTPAQIASTKSSLAFPVNNAAIGALPKALQYTNATDVLAKIPLLPGVTVETNTPYVPFQQWLSAWETYKG